MGKFIIVGLLLLLISIVIATIITLLIDYFTNIFEDQDDTNKHI